MRRSVRRISRIAGRSAVGGAVDHRAPFGAMKTAGPQAVAERPSQKMGVRMKEAAAWPVRGPESTPDRPGPSSSRPEHGHFDQGVAPGRCLGHRGPLCFARTPGSCEALRARPCVRGTWPAAATITGAAPVDGERRRHDGNDPTSDAATAGAAPGIPGWRPRPARSSPHRSPGRSASVPRTAGTGPRATRRAARCPPPGTAGPRHRR